MKSRVVCAVFVAISALALVIVARSQKLITHGEWAGFVQEQPPLDYVRIDTPFAVRQIQGTIYGADHKPLANAYFEIGIGKKVGIENATLGTYTDEAGRFNLLPSRTILGKLPRSGEYRFKVTKNGFHSAVGKLVVSSRTSKENAIAIELQPGPQVHGR